MKCLRDLLVICIFSMLIFANRACAEDYWVNDAVSLFKANRATIYELNIRTFGAKDLDNDGIIDETKGEARGTFINAISHLDELTKLGINTIHLLPITPVGKVKALGTAGSLYSASDFDRINPQLVDKFSNLSDTEQAKLFIAECHRRKIRVLIDLPACGAYDLYLKHPEFFVTDSNNKPIVPSDWTDVRLLNSGSETEINQDVYTLYTQFVDMVIDLGADGIRADVAPLKTSLFWKKLIRETKAKDPQFLFLAEAYNNNAERISEYAPQTSYEKLLNAGFDSYYSNFSEIKNWTTPKELYDCIKFNMNLQKKYNYQKSVISSFSTHDEVSPILLHGTPFSIMIEWLSATLPFNQYFTDGFPSGDPYLYPWANKKASKSFTDDDYYFLHRGKLDIFNFSKKPGGKNTEIYNNFEFAQKFRFLSGSAMQKSGFKILRTSDSHVFAYKRYDTTSTLIVTGNLDFSNSYNKVKIFAPGINKDMTFIPLHSLNMPFVTKGKVTVDLFPGDIQVFYLELPQKNKKPQQKSYSQQLPVYRYK
ncbi:hypothetical protein KBA27_03190 [bacterium]|nr:hypothetical protein [bacterium]